MVEATHKNFATLTVYSMEGWLLSSEKNYECVDTMFTTTYEKLEMLFCVREPRNAHDRYTVAVEKDGMVINHLL